MLGAGPADGGVMHFFFFGQQGVMHLSERVCAASMVKLNFLIITNLFVITTDVIRFV